MNILVINYWDSQAIFVPNASEELIEMATKVKNLPPDSPIQELFEQDELIEALYDYGPLQNADKPINGPTMVVQIF